MSQLFTVTEIVGQNEWAPQDNPSRKTVFYDFTAKEGPGQVFSIGRKPDNPLKVGDSFEADVTGEAHGKVKLKRVQQFQGGGGPRPEDPVRSARILRQHSQDMALRAVEISVGMGVAEKPANTGEFFELVKKAADWFDKDANTAATNEALSGQPRTEQW